MLNHIVSGSLASARGGRGAGPESTGTKRRASRIAARDDTRRRDADYYYRNFFDEEVVAAEVEEQMETQ